MATTRSVGYKVSASVWNAVHTSISDDGGTWSGAVNGTTGLFTPSLAVAGAGDNGGLSIGALSTNRPAISFTNVTTGVLAFIQADNSKNLLLYANGSSTFVAKLHSDGGMSIGGTVSPGPGNLCVAGGWIAMGVESSPSIQIYAAGQPGTGSISQGNSIVVDTGAFGAGAIEGSRVFIGYNSSGNGAAGYLALVGRTGSFIYYWTDATGVLRRNTAAPTEGTVGSDTAGQVVGDQTSWHELKTNIVATAVTPADALKAIVETPIYDFEYPGGSRQNGDGASQVFTGFVGYDRRDWFLTNAGPLQTPALNQITVPGYLALAVKALEARVTALETP